MLLKIDKKVLLILIVVLAIIMLFGFAAYKYLSKPVAEVQNSAGGAEINEQVGQDSSSSSGGQNSEAPDAQIETGDRGGGLIICADQCGNGVCQGQDLECPKNSLNCICPETPQECPQDCK